MNIDAGQFGIGMKMPKLPRNRQTHKKMRWVEATPIAVIQNVEFASQLTAHDSKKENALRSAANIFRDVDAFDLPLPWTDPGMIDVDGFSFHAIPSSMSCSLLDIPVEGLPMNPEGDSSRRIAAGTQAPPCSCTLAFTTREKIGHFQMGAIDVLLQQC